MFKIRAGYMLRRIVDEWVVVSYGEGAARAQSFMLLNETGAMLWQMMQTGADVRGMAQALIDEYGLDAPRAHADAAAFAARLVADGIAIPSAD
ncbi:MAG: PqqD family protein, partial [Christensenellales bacterium]